MRIVSCVIPIATSIFWPWFATAAFWILFGACIADVPDRPDEPPARLVTSWDPGACGEPHRVVLELENDDGVAISSSAPCWLGGVTLDAPRWGLYRGRVYAWQLGEAIRSISNVEIPIDAPIVRWQLTPPP